jgi:DNA-binding NtrC family response regulator
VLRIVEAKILIVDDEPVERSVLEEELIAAGYSVVTAADSLQAAQELSGSAFEVVVMKLFIPGQDVLSFLREIKKQNPTPAMIVLTDYESIETAVEAMKIGAFDYLQKPFSTEELLLKIDKLLQYKRMAYENEELHRQIALRHIENKIMALGKADQEDAIQAREIPDESFELLSLKLSEMERVDIGAVVEDLETQLIRWALEKAVGNLTKAAEMLGLPRSTLQYKINRRSSSNSSMPKHS